MVPFTTTKENYSELKRNQAAGKLELFKKKKKKKIKSIYIRNLFVIFEHQLVRYFQSG